ncbi:MAG TPA: 16S rRNA (guanine(527)-N(7))-methyltransferase RsmG [Acidothermaceae bacterium]
MTHAGVEAVIPPPPALAQVLFGAHLPLARRYAEWLAGAGVERGLIGPREAERLWPRHLLNCVAVAALIPTGSHVVDLGSGAGLPGIVLAIARPDLQITLIEPMQRRVAFLDEVRSDLSLAGVDTRRVRADELTAAKLNADIVTARAVAPVGRLAALAAPLLRADGQLLAIKGSGFAAEVSAGWSAVQRAGMTLDAALLAIVAADSEVASSGGGLEPGDAKLLPGVLIAELSTWQSNGLLCEGVAGRARGRQLSTDQLALVLRLGQSGHRPTRHH